MTQDRMIITAASAAFGPSLLAFLGSLNLNWPGHPPVRVYDIGLDASTLDLLKRHRIEVVRVPAFCPHWRLHFTWKIWCWNDAPAREILWMDSGLVVLRPLDEAFESIRELGYFVVPTYHSLAENASVQACEGCGVAPDFREGKMTLAGTLIGFRKEGKIANILKEVLSIALVEKYIASTEKMHRHDQMLISILLYKHIGQPLVSDGILYCGWLSPNQTPGQKIWVHRRGLLSEDQRFLQEHISKEGTVYLPRDPVASRPARTAWKRVFGAPERFIRRLIRGELGKQDKPYNGIRDRS